MSDKNYSLIKTYARTPEVLKIFSNILGERRAESFVYSVIMAVSADDNLKNCTPESIFQSASRAATLQLSVDPSVMQAYLVPYKNEATLIVGWRGYRDLAYRTGQVKRINVNALYEGQQWIEDALTGEASIEGRPISGEVQGYFAYMQTVSGREHSLYMTNEQIQNHKVQYAKGYNRQQSAWNTSFDKMAKKTVLKQLLSMWATLDPTGIMIESIEAMDNVDSFPTIEEVTIIEPEPRPPNEIIAELGFEQEEAKAKVVQKKEEQVKDGVPKTKEEYYAAVMAQEVPYVGIKDAQDAFKQSKENVDIAWEMIQSLSKERLEINKKGSKSQGQGKLL